MEDTRADSNQNLNSSEHPKMITQCPACKAKFKIKGESINKKAKCSKCGDVFVISSIIETPVPPISQIVNDQPKGHVLKLRTTISVAAILSIGTIGIFLLANYEEARQVPPRYSGTHYHRALSAMRPFEYAHIDISDHISVKINSASEFVGMSTSYKTGKIILHTLRYAQLVAGAIELGDLDVSILSNPEIVTLCRAQTAAFAIRKGDTAIDTTPAAEYVAKVKKDLKDAMNIMDSSQWDLRLSGLKNVVKSDTYHDLKQAMDHYKLREYFCSDL